MTEEQEVQAPEDESDSYDTSDKEAVNKAKKKASRTKADRLKFIRAAMSHPEGRAWFNDLLIFCRIFSSPFDIDPHRTAFLCGQANVGIRILSDIQEAAPEFYLAMVIEGKEREKR